MTPNELLLGFVRGEVNWSALRDIGVVVRLDSGPLRLEGGPPQGDIHPQAADVEAGMRALARDPEARREWAAVLLGLTEVDLEGIDESLLETLWDTADPRQAQ